MSILSSTCAICLDPIYTAPEKPSKTVEALDLAQKTEKKTDQIFNRLGIDAPEGLANTHVYHQAQAGDDFKLHVGHSQCAIGWLKQNPTCPECRQPVNAPVKANAAPRVSSAREDYAHMDRAFDKIMSTFCLLMIGVSAIHALCAGPDYYYD